MKLYNMNKLSNKSINMLRALFATNSNLQLPVGVAEEVVEIRAWIEEEVKEEIKEEVKDN